MGRWEEGDKLDDNFGRQTAPVHKTISLSLPPPPPHLPILFHLPKPMPGGIPAFHYIPPPLSPPL